MSSTDADRSSSTVLVMAIIGVLALAGVIAVFGGSDSPPIGFEPDEIAAPVIDGEAVPPDATGVPAPQVTADALLNEGQARVPVADQGTMIVFLAHWCSHCNAEVPVVNQWLEESGVPDRTEVRAVATAIDENAEHYPPTTWLREREWTVPTLVDIDGSIAGAYGISSYPSWVFVGADGTVLGSGGAQSAEALQQIAQQLHDDAVG